MCSFIHVKTFFEQTCTLWPFTFPKASTKFYYFHTLQTDFYPNRYIMIDIMKCLLGNAAIRFSAVHLGAHHNYEL